MKLLLFRHGIAEDQGADGDDASRALTREGMARTQSAARGLVRIADQPDVILTSPKRRARQTADIIAGLFDMQPQVLDALANGSVDAILKALATRTERNVMVVGHEPTFSELIERVCAGRVGGFVQLKKAGCACVELQNGRGALHWLMMPRQLRELGNGR